MSDLGEHATVDLLALAQAGNQDALNVLLKRYRDPVTRWAHGRLPRRSRSLRDTEDLVQDVLMGAVKQLPRLRFERTGGLHAYLKAALLNRIKNERRSASRRPRRAELDPELPDSAASPFDLAVTKEDAERYEAALARLPQADREAIIARLEFNLSGQPLAAALQRPSVDAARMAVTRAVLRLARLLAERTPSA